jgi:hypothetical protein
MKTTISIQKGEPFAATVKTEVFEAKIEKATLDGEAIHFEVTMEIGTLVYDGEVAGDEMDVTVLSPSGNKYSMNCERQKEILRCGRRHPSANWTMAASAFPT